MVHLSLIRRPTAMPEKQPLQSLTPFELVFEPEDVVLVGEFQEVEELGRGLHYRERRGLGVVEEDGDAAIGVEAEEPVFLLLVGHDVAGRERGVSEGLTECWGGRRRVEGEEVDEHESCSPFGAINIMQLFQHDLDLLAIGRALRDEVQSFCVLHLGGGGIFE